MVTAGLCNAFFHPVAKTLLLIQPLNDTKDASLDIPIARREPHTAEMKRNYIEFAEDEELTPSGKSARPKPGRERYRAFKDDTISLPLDRRSLCSDTLCAVCSRIDFDNIFYNPHVEKPAWSPEMFFAPNCALCNMARSLLKVDLGDGCGWHFWHLGTSLGIKAGGHCRDSANFTIPGRTVFLEVRRGWGRTTEILKTDEFDKSRLRGLVCVQDCRIPENGKRTVPFTGSNEINQHKADFGLMREWLKQRCEPHSELADGGETLINAPQTVKDAMYATKRLGQRYLWVDRYCIPEEGNEKHVHIANMHLIYEAAYVTIVAANPGPKDSAHSGLYGVSKPRNSQDKFIHHGRLFLSAPVHLAYQLSQSVWATRGWTYQEAALSSRCLLFTPDGVYYADFSGYQVESLRHSLSPGPKGGYQGFSPASLLPDYRVNPFAYGNVGRAYDKHLLEYVKRSLTFPSDALNAFRGILAKAAGASVWGIPFMPPQSGSASESLQSDFYFAKRLCWTGESNCEERQKKLKHFPSWSWASVSKIRSVVAYCGDRPVGKPLDIQPHALFAVERADGSVVALRQLVWDRTKSHQIIPEETFFLHVTSWVFQATVKLDEQSQTWHVTGLRSSGDQNMKEILTHKSTTHFDVRGSGLAIFEVKPRVVVTAVLTGLSYFTGGVFLLLERGADFYRRVGLFRVFGRLTADLIEKATKSFPPVTIRLR
ncbi:hypothetical protein LTS15_007600 [Exophiala xenobiotica]|nr:hypothetical protein LTS15_007600 [Exophiala xenobiotica]